MTTALDTMSTNSLGANMSCTCAVRLIDRRTGASHRVNGRAVMLLSLDPALAARTLLAGRDAAVWEARIEPFGPAGVQA